MVKLKRGVGMKLNALTVQKAKPKDKVYKLSDGRGLCCVVRPGGSKLWHHKYVIHGRSRTIAYGAFPEVSLSQARQFCDETRLKLAKGIDPLKERAAKRQAQQAAMDTFSDVAASWQGTRLVDKSAKYKTRCEQLLRNDLLPALGDLPIAEIDAPTLLKPLRKMEARGVYESTHKALGVARAVFNFAIAEGRCERNPARDLAAALKKPDRGNNAAVIDPVALGRILGMIEHYEGLPSIRLALNLAPMLLSRPFPLRHMEWSEIDFDAQVWNIPKEKMKGTKGKKRPLVVPLSRQAVALLQAHERTSHLVMPGVRSPKRPISENTINVAMRQVGITKEEQTGHGFRATARTILDEVLNERPDFIEAQLGHAVKDATGTAYNRTKFLKQRAEMMQRWSDYLDQLRGAALSKNIITGNFRSAG